jgi:hypothetical protein
MKAIDENGHFRLLGLGIGLIVFSIVLAIILGFGFREVSEITTFVTSLLGSAGIALIVIALVESRHLRSSLEKTSIKIIDRTRHGLDDKFNETFNILEHRRYNGLIDILAPRQDEKRGNETREIIAGEIIKSQSIFVFSISGLDFFGYPRGACTAAGRYYSAIDARIDAVKKEGQPLKLQVRVLLMDPKSDAAKFRNCIETVADTPGDIEGDIRIAEEGMSKLNSKAGEDFIRYLCYSMFPQAGFIGTDSCIFVEPYHYAPTEELCQTLQEKDLNAHTLSNNCTGGRIPVLQFDCNSNMYLAMKKHFDSIWKYEESKQGDPNTSLKSFG